MNELQHSIAEEKRVLAVIIRPPRHFLQLAPPEIHHTM